MQADFDVGALYEALDAQRRGRGLSWPQLARELGGISPSTLTGMRDRGSVEGDGALQMLRWLGRSPESFLPEQEGATRGTAQLPTVADSGVLRFDAWAIYDALDAQRIARGLTWRQVAAEVGLPNPESLTRLRQGGRVGFPLVMRIFAWLGQPAARFVRVSDR